MVPLLREAPVFFAFSERKSLFRQGTATGRQGLRLLSSTDLTTPAVEWPVWDDRNDVLDTAPTNTPTNTLTGGPGGCIAGTDTVLRSPVIDLTDVAGAALAFAPAIDIETPHFLVVKVAWLLPEGIGWWATTELTSKPLRPLDGSTSARMDWCGPASSGSSNTLSPP